MQIYWKKIKSFYKKRVLKTPTVLVWNTNMAAVTSIHYEGSFQASFHICDNKLEVIIDYGPAFVTHGNEI